MRLTVSDIPEDGIEKELRFYFSLFEKSPALDVLVSIKVSRFGDRVIIEGSIRASADLKCSRCIKDFSVPLNVDFSTELVPFEETYEEHERELTVAELDTGFYRDDEIDLESLVREHILLSLPMKPLCKSECQGLCPSCGKDLNKVSCECSRETIDPRLEPLKRLRTK
jgi:uncharacterized protein